MKIIKNNNNSYLLIVLVLTLSGILILADNIQFAYAVTYTIIITTGTQTDDACGAGSIDQNGKVWLLCAGNTTNTNPVLGIYEQNGTLLKNITLTSAGNVQSDMQMFPSFTVNEGSAIIFHYPSTDSWVKYRYASGTITKIGEYVPASCTVSISGEATYDINGFIWFTCKNEDLVKAFNPTSMSESFTSPDLTDGVGIECDAPESVAFDYTTNTPNQGYMILGCDLTNSIVTASVDYSAVPFTFVAMVDDLVLSSTLEPLLESVYVDPQSNRAFHDDSASGLDTYTWNDAGVISASTQNIGNAEVNSCYIDAFIASDRRIMLCMSSTNLQGFISNSTGVFQVINTAIFENDVTFLDHMVNTFGTGGLWVIHAGAQTDNIQRFMLVNTLDLEVAPTPPPTPPPTGVIGGIDCALPENVNILICRLGGDSNFGGIGNSTGTGLLNIGCNVIFVDCTDTNPQTNGLGLLAFIASLFVIIGMFYYAIGKEAFHMPIFIWIVIVIALSAFFTIAGWIDPIFLILAIVAVVAMAVPKIINVIRGNTFGSGSSE